MTHVRRLSAVAAILAVAALYTATTVRGGPGKDGPKELLDGDAKKPAVEDNLAATKFADRQIVTYVTKDGKTIFGQQLKPAIPASPRLGRDYLLLVGTTPSMARGPVESARLITAAILKDLEPQDVASVWTVNVEPKKLTKTFINKDNKKAIDEVNKALKEEYPSGAANLRKTLAEAVKGFENE